MSIEPADHQVTLLDAENPWPGLISFSEANRAFFFGREQEISDLVRRISQEPLTVFFGKSGLGKSSILQAGLTPKLRNQNYLPIYIRLDYSQSSPPLATQVLQNINAAIDSEHIDAPRPTDTQTLWEYFQDRNCDWWNEQNQLVKPVLMFDQFEELLTLGQSTPSGSARVRDFLLQLEDLADNRVPAFWEKQFGAQPQLAERFDFNRQSCRIILVLREDFLADLESLHERLRPIMRNRFRLLPMNLEQAVRVILQPGSHLVDPDVAVRIVQFVASPEADPTESRLDETVQVEPALLSVVLRELNNLRLASGAKKISADLLLQGEAVDILQSFYDGGLEGLGPEVAEFIADSLLTASGARNRIAEEDALTHNGITPEVLASLIDRRILQRQSSGGMKWLELTHDTLAGVVRRSRAEIVQRRELKEANAREAEIHRNLVRSRKLSAVFATVMVVALFALGWALLQHHQLVTQRKQLREESLDLERELRRSKEFGEKLATQEISLSRSQKTLQDQIAELKVKDEALVGDAEASSREIVKTLWAAESGVGAGDVAGVRSALSILSSFAIRFPASGELAEQNALGHALGADAMFEAGHINDGVAVARQAMMLSDMGDGLARSLALYVTGRGELETGTYDRAAQHLRASMAASSAGGETGAPRMLEVHVMAVMTLGDTYLQRWHNVEARQQYATVLSFTGKNSSALLQYLRARTYAQIGVSRFQDDDEAAKKNGDEQFQLAEDLLEQMRHSAPDNLRLQSLYTEVVARHALYTNDNNERRQQIVHVLQSVQTSADEIYNADRTNHHRLYVVAMIGRELGAFYKKSGDITSAELAFERASTDAKDAVSTEDHWIMGRLLYGMALSDEADIHEAAAGRASQNKDKLAEKAKEKDKAILTRDTYRSLASLAGDNPKILYLAAYSDLALGNLQAEERKYEDAEMSYNEARSQFRAIDPQVQKSPQVASVPAIADTDEGLHILSEQNRFDAAERALLRAISEHEVTLHQSHAADYYSYIAECWVSVGNVQVRKNDPSDVVEVSFKKGLQSYDEGLHALAKLGRDQETLKAEKVRQQTYMVSVWQQRKEYRRAESILDSAAKQLTEEFQANLFQPDLLESYSILQPQGSSLLTAVKAEVPKDESDRRQKEELIGAVEKTNTTLEMTDLMRPKGARLSSDRAMLEVDSSEAWVLPPLVPGTWVQLSGEEENKEKEAAKNQLNKRSKSEFIVRRIRKLPVLFYPDANLFEAEVATQIGELGVYEYVRSGDKLLQLDGSSDGIHKFERATVSEQGVRRGVLRLDTLEQAAQYAHFFTGAIQGTDGGTFTFIDSASELPLEPGASYATREKLDRIVAPFRLRQTSNGRWSGQGTILYNSSLSYAALVFDATKADSVTVSMPADSPATTQQWALPKTVFHDGVRIPDVQQRVHFLGDEQTKSQNAQDWSTAAKQERQIIVLLRQSSVIAQDKKPALISEQYVNISWAELMLKRFKDALEAADAGLVLNPQNIALDTNRAHALLFLGRIAEAEALYRRHVGETIGKQKWEDVILDDLKNLQSAGLQNPNFTTIRTMMESAKSKH